MSEQDGGAGQTWGPAAGGIVRLLGGLAGIGAAVLLLSACRVEGLAFRQDKRLEIVSPPEHATVRPPVTVRWKVRDSEGPFGVFVDTDPPGPGKSLRSLAEGDLSCKVTPGCPDERWFAARGIHTTTDTSFRIDSLSDRRRPGRPRSLDRHEVTVVLLNEDNERVGESGVAVEFFVDRRAR